MTRDFIPLESKPIVLVAIEVFDQARVGLVEKLESQGFQVRINSTGHALNYGRDRELYQEVTHVVAGLEVYDEEFFRRFPSVQVVSRVGVGVDAIDLAAAKRAGCAVFRTSDQPSVAVAELCISNMIALLRQTFQMSEVLRTGGWKPIQGKELRNCRVGVVGLGSIGKEVAKRVSVFGSKLFGAGRTWDTAFAERYSIQRLDLEELMSTCDVVTVHLPLTRDTEGMISANLIARLPAQAILLNTSRSAVVDNVALARAIRENRIAGAAIDVFHEHRSIKPYDDVPNVILTPHIGSHTIETRKSMEAMAVENIVKHRQLERGVGGNERAEIHEYLRRNQVSE